MSVSHLVVSADDIHELTASLTTAADALSTSSLDALVFLNQSAIIASGSVIEALGASASIQRLRIELTAANVGALAASGNLAAARMLTEDLLLAGQI